MLIPRRKKSPTLLVAPPPALVDESPHQELINQILEAAAAKAEKAGIGEVIFVKVEPEDTSRKFNYMEIEDRVFVGSVELGLTPESHYDGTFEFSKTP